MRRVLLAAALVALALPASAHGWARFPLFDQAASEIAGRPVEVRCAYPGEWETMAADPTWAGYTWFQDGRPQYVTLSPATCWALLLLAVDPDNTVSSRLSFGNQQIVLQQGWALLTLAHEAVHMSGVRDEGETECRAMSHVDRLIARFGVDFRRVELRNRVEAAHRAAPPEYRTVC